MRRPVIGLTTTLEEGSRRHELWRAYPNAIERAGGLPVILPSDDKHDHYDEYLNVIDGLLLTGGQDVHPFFYGSEPYGGLTEAWPMCPPRDRFEIALTRLARDRGRPILGLCRGLQVLAVAFGGTLWQDVSVTKNAKIKKIRHFQNLDPRWPSHQVEIAPGQIKDLFGGASVMKVNSLHHQSCAKTPSGFKITARAQDGVVEAIESESGPFAVGVQWHPELLVRTDVLQLELFKALVLAAQNVRR